MSASVSQPLQNPSSSQAESTTSASQPAQSWATTAKKAVSSPSNATGAATPSPAVAVGGSVSVQHGKSNSISPVNGTRGAPIPAVPTFNTAPAVAHSSPVPNGADHSRKTSVTINANGPSYPNGGPVGGGSKAIQFGSITDSPAPSHSTPQVAPSPSTPIPISNNNPRVTSPAQSPSPIPQPSASGGRPPSGLAQQGNGVTFGSLGGDGDRHMRQASATQASPALGTQAAHIRRESSQSAQSEGQGRGGYSNQAGRGGRATFNAQYPPPQQQMGFPPSAPPYRSQSNAGRGGMAPPFQGQGRPINQPYPNSPHQAARSPALSNSIPGTPNINQAMPLQNSQPYGGYYQQMPGPSVKPLSISSAQRSNSFHSQKGASANRHGHPTDKLGKGLPTSEPREIFGHTFASQDSRPLLSGSYQLEDAVLTSGNMGATEHTSLQNAQDSALMPSSCLEDRSHVAQNLPPIPIPLEKLPFKIDLSPESDDFAKFVLTLPQQQQPQYPYGQYGGGMPPYNGGAMAYPQVNQMTAYMPQAPHSPQPGYHQPNQYMPGPYQNQQGQPMSRNSSQMSEHRPASSMGQAQTPSLQPAVLQSQTPQPKPTPGSPAFQRPPGRKSAAIVIKRPDGEAIDLETIKGSPGPRTRTPPVIASTPTPPPKSSTPLHTRTDSSAINTKNAEQIKLEMMEKVKKAAATESQNKADDEAKAAADAKTKAESTAAEEAKTKAISDAKTAADKAKEDEEAEMERQIQEMEEAELKREKAEQELLAKRAAEKASREAAEAEKKKAEAAENDRKLQEQEREMERLEDEKERKRAEASAQGSAPDVATELKKSENKDVASDEKLPETPATLASRFSSLTIETESGASTPASDDSMGPPPPKPSSTEKRVKPAALNLAPISTKPVEPPQPSAALQSLKSARFLTVLSSSIYPPNISSPNPALNSAVTTKGKSFKYDKEFLLQFQKVFVEKPSVEFAAQVKNLIGDPSDGGSARSASTRGASSGMGPRQGSSRGAPGAFAMGSFGAPGGKTLPPGTTSDQRYAMATGSMPRPAMGNPLASFSRPGGAFPAGNAMTRTPSSSGMNSMPHSPRQQSRSQRGNSKRDNYQGNAKQEAQAAKTMPLTAGMELKPIQVTATGWKPRSVGANQSATGAAGPAPGASGAAGHMEPDMVQRKVKAALNKMTPEKFDKIADQILAIAAQSKDEADGRTLRQVIQLTFEKATDEAHWASMYAKFCKRMLETMNPDIKDASILDRNGNVVSGGNLFRKYLLNRCQEEFERGWKMDLPDKPEGERGEEKTEEAAMLSDEYYIAAAAKRRGLGLVQFIGELYKLSMLTERIMHECVKKLVDYTGIPDEAEIESLTKLLKTIGANLDGTEKGKPMMDVYFARIQTMIDTPDLPSRLRFMLMDIVDLRKKAWQSKEANKGPKTLEEVRAEAEAAAAQKAAENARSNQRGGGGGGRMQMGRGDSRNFSNQYGNQHPVDYQKNTVGMDDLRRLGSKARQTSQQMSFGPTSMFSSRSNSGRKMGPGGSLTRGGEDSGTSSRTGTPPQQKEKESATSANAFSLLAGLGSGETEAPASPPSVVNSPELSKATPSSKSEDKESES